MMVEGEGFEPSKAEPSDLQSDPFGHSGTPPQVMLFSSTRNGRCCIMSTFCSFKMSKCNQHNLNIVVEGEGFEPSKAEPSDLQSDPFGHSGTPPQVRNG
jgi:hypothetical protein